MTDMGVFSYHFFFANSGRFCFFKRTALVLKLDSHNYMLLYIACKKKTDDRVKRLGVEFKTAYKIYKLQQKQKL